MNKVNWISAIRCGGSFVYSIALKMLDLQDPSIQRQSNGVNEILLYGADNRKHMLEIGLNNLLCIYYKILHAEKTVDVCVPTFVSDTFARCLIKVQHNNVKIRIIIHNSDNFKNLQLLAQNGIEVKVINPDLRLEHEFLLIDARDKFENAVAIMGSLDYDTNRVNQNRDATVLTSEIVVIETLKKEFDRIWNSFSDTKYTKDDRKA